MRKFLNLSFALALVAGLFAGSLATAGAISPTYGPETPGLPTIYFPFVYNGTTLDGSGPYDGSVTIQNPNNLAINVSVTDAAGKALKSFALNPRASKTYSAAALGVADGGGGVIATATYTAASVSTMLDLGMCPVSTSTGTQTVTRGADTTTTDTFKPNADFGTDQNGNPAIKNITAGGTTYVNGTDFTAAYDTNGNVVITWINAPAQGTVYTVNYYKAVCPAPTIAGVEKHVAPVQNGNPVKTNADQTTVDGYTAVSGCDMALAMDDQSQACDLAQPGIPGGFSSPELDMNQQSRWILPIVQTNTGWDSVIHVTNVSKSDGVGVNGYFYAANGQGNAGPSQQVFSTTLDKGQTLSFDLMKDGNFPVGNVGSLWIDGDAGIVASVDRVKSATDMALTNVAQPRNDNIANYVKIVGKNPTIKYAPLVFKDYNNWNTGINVANLSSVDNKVTVTYYNYLDNSTSQDTKTIPARGMEYFYMPGSGTDIGLGNQSISSAIVEGSQPLAAAVDEVKYNGGSGAGHAMSYPAQYGAYAGEAYDTTQFPLLTDLFQNYITGFAGGRVFYSSQLNLPLVQKGSATTGLGDTSGINLFNGDASNGVTAFLQFEDSSGLPVAPTNDNNDAESPIQIPIGALASHTIYTMNYSDLPEGFQGSAVVGVVYNTSAGQELTGPLVGVSNNVNYDVSGDGSSVFNMNVGYQPLPDVNPGCYYPAFPNSDIGVQQCNPFPAP